ncbi:MAG: hypothetical protein LBB38_02700 [Puniceicoccales bacterium]|jgi:hypothetical protein|nr:hypothetical protein [Puniceicoccales bacterium]
MDVLLPLSEARALAQLETTLAELASARHARAEQRMALRQKAFDMSSAFWRAFHTVYHIRDEDIKHLLSGLPQEDIDAILAK